MLNFCLFLAAACLYHLKRLQILWMPKNSRGSPHHKNLLHCLPSNFWRAEPSKGQMQRHISCHMLPGMPHTQIPQHFSNRWCKFSIGFPLSQLCCVIIFCLGRLVCCVSWWGIGFFRFALPECMCAVRIDYIHIFSLFMVAARFPWKSFFYPNLVGFGSTEIVNNLYSY